MTRRTAFFFLTFLLTALVFAPAVHAESLVMNMKRTVTFTPASESTPPIVTDEVVTFYPEFISVRTGNAERIYNFAAKTLVVFDHADKTYMIHPLHAVPIFYERERTRRLAMKIKMNEATREAGGAAVDKVFLEDIDLDMAFSAQSNTRTEYMIERELGKEGTVFRPKKEDYELARYTPHSGVLSKELKRTYARYLAHEIAVHPVIEDSLAKVGQVFGRLEYMNKDTLRKTNAKTVIELTSASVKPDNMPTMPEGYRIKRSNDPKMNALMERSLTAPALDMEALSAHINELMDVAINDKTKSAEAFIYTSEIPLMLSAADAQKYQSALLNPGFLVGENFENPLFAAVTRSPGNTADLAKFLNVLDSYKGKVGEKDYLLDYFKAQHIRKVLAVKPEPTEEEQAQLKQAHDYIIAALEKNPRLINAYFDLGGSAFQDNQIMDAFIYWDHAARLSPKHETLYGIRKLQEDAERKFPEFF